MGQVSPPEPRADVRYALAGGLTLLAGVVAALALAFVLSRTVGGLYITFLMPALAGWVIGGAVGWVAARFELRDRVALVMTAVMAGLVAYGGYQMLAYASFMDHASTHLLTTLERAAANPGEQVLALLERQTGEEGLAAYLAFVSTPPGSALSPVGLLGHGGLGLGGTVALIAVEAVLVVATTLLSTLRRFPRLAARPVAAPAARRFAILGRLDDTGVVALMDCVTATDTEGGARVLARGATPGPATHGVVLEHGPDPAVPWKLAIRALEPDGSLGAVRAERSLPSLQGQSLWDELRMLQRSNAPPEAP